MGYIKKLKSNELVGGTDKTTIYPVTSTEAVFEEVIEDGESNFKSQKFLNNNITGDRINEGTITDYNIATGTITKGKLTSQVQTMLDEGQKKALTPKGDYDAETVYEALDLVFDRDSNSSYVSLITPNTEPLTNEDAWEMFLDGTSVNTAQATINAKVEELDTQVNNKIDDAQDQLDAKIENVQEQLDAVTQEATDAAIEARNAASTVETLTSQQVADAQIGYFTCTNTAASGAADNETKITTTDAIGESHYVKTVGSHVKVKMAVANTHAAPVYLQFGSNTANKAQLYYNGEAASASNSWEENEVISVYYDGTNYQASNAMGGGSAVGKKKLTPIPGYIENYETTLGPIHTASADRTNYRYIKYPAKEGDVVQISGTGDSAAKLWGIVGEENVMLNAAAASVSATNLILVMPEGTTFITINSKASSNPEWYYAKAGSIGAHEMLTEAYLYGELRNLNAGETYTNNEAVKTTDKQLLKVSKEIGLMNLIDTVVVGDLKVYGTGANAATYKALKAVSTYNGVDTEGLYAIGNPSIATITVDASSLSIEEDTDISVTIGSATHTITVPAAESETKAADIAALIAAAFTSIPGWSLTDNSDGTLTLKYNTGGANSISVSSEVGETGLVITSSIINGGNKLSKYSNGAWQAVTLANYAADFADVGVVDNTKMWQKVDATWLTTLSNGVVAQANSPKLYDTFGYDSNGAITRKVATEEMMYYESIALHNYLITGTYLITVGTTQWNSNARNDIYVIPVESNNVYRITSSNEIQYCWMSDYVTPNAGDYIKNVPGYVCTRITSRFIDITAPLGAKYLYVLSIYRTSISSTSFDPSSISVLKSKLGEIQPLVESNSYDLYIEDFKLSSLPNSTEPKGVAGNNRYSWNTTSNYYGVWINVTAYAGRRIRFKVPAERYMFVSSKPSASTNPLTTLLGDGIVQSNGNDTIIPNPATENGQVWMWVYTYNKDRTPQTIYTISNISVLQKMADSLTSISEDTNNALKYTSAKEVTLANLPGTKSNGLVEMTGTSYNVNSNYYGYWYDVTYYAGKKIRLEKGRYDLFFSTQILTTNTQIAPYALGIGFVRGEAEEIGDIKIPSPSTTDGKVYCWVLTHESSVTHPSKYYSIVENVPDRIKDITENTIYSQDKILYWARYTNSNAKNFGLLHFSDFHGDPNAYYELQDYISRHSSMFNDVIETGDNVYNYNSDWKGKVNNKALFVLGNHDCGVGGNVRKDGIGRQACFNYYFNPYLSYWKANEEGGVQIDNENYAMYWYKDYTGIRLIGLDGMHFMGRDDITDEDQETWFEETLNDAKAKDLKVMVACHFGLDDFSGEYSRWNEQTHKWEYNFITDTSNSNTGGRVMNSSTGKAVPYHWYGNNSWTWDKNGFTMRVQQACNGYSIGTNRFGDILSNWIDGGGTFIAWIGGHVHQNLMYYPARYPNILNIIVSNAGTSVDSPGEYKRNNGDFVRIAANIYYVSGDYLTVVKVGDNIQRPSLVPMSWLTINYRTGEVASCY